MKIMSSIVRYLSENPRLLKDFKFWLLKQKSKPTTSTLYSGSFLQKWNCWEGFLDAQKTIIFYEWSDINGSKKFFKKIKDFYEFLDESNIKFPDYGTRNVFEENEIVHVICKVGKPELLVANSKQNLITLIEKEK